MEGGDYRPIKPIAKAWLNLGLAGFCERLAAREGDSLPATVDWSALERRGWQRQREVMQLSLPRAAFRRAIELWLVLDMACHLERNGYRVTLQRFCGRDLSPRNILLTASRESN